MDRPNIATLKSFLADCHINGQGIKIEFVRELIDYIEHLESSNYCHECHSRMHIDAETCHKAKAYDALMDVAKGFKIGRQ